jgi:Trypsin-co-occurring domain 1
MPEILVHVVPRQQDDQGKMAATFIGPESFSKRATDISDGVSGVANAIRADLERKIVRNADSSLALKEIELKFSLDLEAEAGVVIARAKTTAGFEVTLTWKTD